MLQKGDVGGAAKIPLNNDPLQKGLVFSGEISLCGGHECRI